MLPPVRTVDRRFGFEAQRSEAVDIQDQRRSNNFEDRGRGRGGGGGGIPIALLSMVFRTLGIKGTLIVGLALGGLYFFMPTSVRQMLLGEPATDTTRGAGAGSACQLSAENASACDFSRVVLASTEDIWNSKFAEGKLPRYGAAKPSAYEPPTLVVFSDGVTTAGCGNATSGVGPFYCPADRKLYIDPSFYRTMETQLKAPGDFAQAYVVAHEVGHHVQNLIGSSRLAVTGESKNQISVRVELQADCLAGVWGQSARSSLKIDEQDLQEALHAAHRIGDDSLGHGDESSFTHGSSVQRMRWWKRGLDSGDARQCDTFAVRNHAAL
jgi:uncharacterized protein